MKKATASLSVYPLNDAFLREELAHRRQAQGHARQAGDGRPREDDQQPRRGEQRLQHDDAHQQGSEQNLLEAHAPASSCVKSSADTATNQRG